MLLTNSHKNLILIITKKKENMNPSKEEFKNLRKTMSNKELAILLKISMPTVYKIAKQLGCEKKKMGARPKTILKD